MRKGVTLVEVLVVAALLLAAGTLIATLFTIGKRHSETASMNYLVSRGTEEGIDWLRRDLQNAALTSVRVFHGEHPGLSMICCTSPEEPFHPLFNSFGAPRWASEVFYMLEEDDDNVGHLKRWSRAYEKPVPVPASEPDKAEGRYQHVVLQNLLLPEAKIHGVGDQEGFRASFVQRQGGEGGEESLTDRNPGEVVLQGGQDYASTTRLVQVELRLLDVSTTGQASQFSIEFRASPRY